MCGEIKNTFCFRYGKMEPEVVLSAIHRFGPVTREQLEKHVTRGYVNRYLPIVIMADDAMQDEEWRYVCCCEECGEEAR